MPIQVSILLSLFNTQFSKFDFHILHYLEKYINVCGNTKGPQSSPKGLGGCLLLTFWLALKLLPSMQFYFAYIFIGFLHRILYLMLYDLQLHDNVQHFQITLKVSSALQVFSEVNGNPEFHGADCRGKWTSVCICHVGKAP